jgi:hydroxypyruvate isomerase
MWEEIMKFDICLEMVLTDLPYDQRILKIGECGFKSVEFWMHDEKDAVVLKQTAEQAGVDINNLVVNGPAGSPGGSLTDAKELNAYLERVEEVIAFAKKAGISKGITCTGNLIPGLTRAQMRANVENALVEAGKIAARNDFLLVLECLNTHVDHAGYFLDSSIEGVEIIKSVNSPNVKVLYDVYHMQIMEGNVIANVTKNIDSIGHFHSAGVPGRHELDNGELNYPAIIKAIAATGYDGAFGLEYSPAGTDGIASLKHMRALLDSTGVEK